MTLEVEPGDTIAKGVLVIGYYFLKFTFRLDSSKMQEFSERIVRKDRGVGMVWYGMVLAGCQENKCQVRRSYKMR